MDMVIIIHLMKNVNTLFYSKRSKYFFYILLSFNPLVPSAANMRRNAYILILILEGIIKKFSYERRDYESVDEKN